MALLSQAHWIVQQLVLLAAMQSYPQCYTVKQGKQVMQAELEVQTVLFVLGQPIEKVQAFPVMKKKAPLRLCILWNFLCVDA